jgi:perosamine synthetase
MTNPSQPIPWFEPRVAGGEIENLRGVLDRNFLNDGPLTREFERRVAELTQVKYAVAVPSGTVAISLALMALGIGAGDEVIVPDLTFIATANAVRMSGAEPVLVDVEPKRFGISTDAVKAAITPRTKAVVPVDVNGRGADYDFLEPFCRERGFHLVCDAAEAFGSCYNGRPLGSFGDAAALSFSANKTVTTGQGGMVLTNREDVAARLGQLKDQGRLKRGTGGDDLHPTQGYNFKYTDLQAAVGLAQLEVFDARCKQAMQRDVWYREALKDCSGIIFPDYDSQAGEVRQWTDILVEEREKLRAALDAQQMGNRAFWFPLHTQNPYADKKGSFTVASHISPRGLWLPSHFSLSRDDVVQVTRVIRDTLG